MAPASDPRPQRRSRIPRLAGMGMLLSTWAVGMVLGGTPANVPASGQTLAFTETDGHGQAVWRLTFVLTGEPAESCRGGSWRRALALDDTAGYTKNPAYTFAGGTLELLLINDRCDQYESFLGTLADGQFSGVRVKYGKGYRRELGAVSGVRRGSAGKAR